MKNTIFLLLLLLYACGSGEDTFTKEELDQAYRSAGVVTKQDTVLSDSQNYFYASKDGINYYERRIDVTIDSAITITTPSTKLVYQIDYVTSNGYSIHRIPDGWEDSPYIQRHIVVKGEGQIQIGNITFYQEIPVNNSVLKKKKLYTVAKGDTYYSVNKKTGIPIETLKKLTNGKLNIGQKINTND